MHAGARTGCTKGADKLASSGSVHHATPQLGTHRMRSMSLSALSSLNRQCSSSSNSLLMRSATCAGELGWLQRWAVELLLFLMRADEVQGGRCWGGRVGSYAEGNAAPGMLAGMPACLQAAPRSAAASCPPSCRAPSRCAAARGTCGTHPRRPVQRGGGGRGGISGDGTGSYRNYTGGGRRTGVAAENAQAPAVATAATPLRTSFRSK